MKHQKLIRGVIYDNPNLVEEEAFVTADSLSFMVENMDIIDKNIMPKFTSGLPNRDEYLVSMCIRQIIDPIGGNNVNDRNMIIPTNLVDDRLYEDLKKIDIGEEVLHTFIDLRKDEFCKRNDIEPSVTVEFKDTKGNLITEVEFDSKEEAIETIKDLDIFDEKHKNEIIHAIQVA
jgi:hypothetical protein